jgi:hypothetical protein
MVYAPERRRLNLPQVSTEQFIPFINAQHIIIKLRIPTFARLWQWTNLIDSAVKRKEPWQDASECSPFEVA